MSFFSENIWITSDTHFGHNREFLYKPRGFTSIEEHDEEIIKRWNERVKPNDIVYHLGDVMLGDNEHGIECLKRLNGNIHILLGNHDTEVRKDLYIDCDNVKQITVAKRMKYRKFHLYLSHYPTFTSNLEKESLKQCVINLYGHTHQKTDFYNDIPFMYHVGLDSHNCYPVLLDDIIGDCKNKVKECKEYL